MKSQPLTRAFRILTTAGPYIACALVLWRMADWERRLAQWVAAATRVMDASSGQIAEKATALHEQAVEHGARQN